MRIQISSWEDYLKWREGFVGMKKAGEEPALIEKPQDFYEAAEEALKNYAKAYDKAKGCDSPNNPCKSNNTQGIKESEGKLFYELDWNFITQMAERMSTNDKYPVYNWKKEMDTEELKQALFRHVLAVMKGEYEDDGRDMGHLEAIATNVMLINYQLKSKYK